MNDRGENAGPPHRRAHEPSRCLRPPDHAFAGALEEAIEREERAHAHDGEEKDDGRVIDRARGLRVDAENRVTIELRKQRGAAAGTAAGSGA